MLLVRLVLASATLANFAVLAEDFGERHNTVPSADIQPSFRKTSNESVTDGSNELFLARNIHNLQLRSIIYANDGRRGNSQHSYLDSYNSSVLLNSINSQSIASRTQPVAEAMKVTITPYTKEHVLAKTDQSFLPQTAVASKIRRIDDKFTETGNIFNRGFPDINNDTALVGAMIDSNKLLNRLGLSNDCLITQNQWSADVFTEAMDHLLFDRKGEQKTHATISPSWVDPFHPISQLIRNIKEIISDGGCEHINRGLRAENKLITSVSKLHPKLRSIISEKLYSLIKTLYKYDSAVKYHFQSKAFYLCIIVFKVKKEELKQCETDLIMLLDQLKNIEFDNTHYEIHQRVKRQLFFSDSDVPAVGTSGANVIVVDDYVDDGNLSIWDGKEAVSILGGLIAGTYGLLALIGFLALNGTVQKPPVGIPGPPGPDGNKGVKGLPGSDGRDGSKGAKGMRGMKGEMGEKGIKGVKGGMGSHGMKGKKGAKGPSGDKGNKGKGGERGMEGIKGVKGFKGVKGVKGSKRLKGRKGNKGSDGMKGVKGTKGAKGRKGDKGAFHVRSQAKRNALETPHLQEGTIMSRSRRHIKQNIIDPSLLEMIYNENANELRHSFSVDEIVEVTNSLFNEGQRTRGCVKCKLFSFLVAHPTAHLESYILAGFASLLGETSALSLPGEVREGLRHGQRMSCEQWKNTCFVKRSSDHAWNNA